LTVVVTKTETVKAERPDKRKLIIDAGMELIRENGYASTRIIDIANRAGIGKGTVYAYFSSKEEILVAILKEHIPSYGDSITGNINRELSLKEKLTFMADASSQIIEKYGIFAIILVEQLINKSDIGSEAIIEQAAAYRKRISSVIRSIIAEAVADGELNEDINIDEATTFVTVVLSSYVLACLHTKIPNSCMDMPGIMDLRNLDTGRMIDMVLGGIGAKRKESADE